MLHFGPIWAHFGAFWRNFGAFWEHLFVGQCKRENMRDYFEVFLDHEQPNFASKMAN